MADQNPQRDRTLGITAYTSTLLEQLGGRRNLTISAVQSSSSIKAPDTVEALCTLPFRTDHALGRFLADQMHPFFAKLETDVWHYPKGFLPAVTRYRRPIAGTVCDVILQHYADYYPNARSATAYRYWLAMLKRSIERFDLILTISEFSKQRIVSFADRYKLRCPPIRVTYLGTDWSERGKSPAKENFALHLASKEPHKRTSSLLEIWRQREAIGLKGVTLELVGALNDADRVTAEKLKSVRISGRVSSEELRRRFERARALLFPSEIEGFGLPALESYAALTPVVYVKGTATEEILGVGTIGGFTLNSPESFSSALDDVLKMDDAAIALKKCELKQRFSWSRCAEETISAYESVF